MNEVFEVADRAWRGIGVIPASGLKLREAFAAHDAELLFPARGRDPRERVRGLHRRRRAARPREALDCPAFGVECTPRAPLGAPMVSTEGACAAYFLAGRTKEEAPA